MNQSWDKNIFENGQSKQQGKVDTAPSYDHLQSTGSGDKFDKKVPPVSGALSGASQNLLLTPASLQLAQLQAQLTLHRLKLAQSSNTAAAATVLNQVLSNVAMSQPLFNQLRGSSMPQAPGPGFPSTPISFPPPGTPIGTLVGGAFTQNHAGIQMNHYGGGGNMSHNASSHGESGNKASKFQAGFLGGTTAGPIKAGEGGHSGGTGGPKTNSQNNYQRDFYSSESQILDSGHTEQWKNLTGYGISGKLEVGTGAGGSTWAPSTHGFIGPRVELYNPEEPTADPKFSPAGGLGFNSACGQQGFVGYPQQQKCEEGVGMTLQAHQINDYHGVTPSHLPHQCTICEKKVYNLKDWDQHVKGKLHIQNRSLYTDGQALGALHFPVTSEGCRGSALNNNTVAYSSAAGQDVSPGGSTFLQAAPMKSFPLSGAGFTSHQPGTKFVPRKPGPGRVVHICNLPEGSCTENDVINLGLPFGKVTNYILMRSTHQAFVEMAYVEAAQAMVQYYQLHPATINDQKLLIRMSKRYKELQLKKPGKDVESIIQDINSQREREELHDMDRYPPERARSRSPITRSLTPPSHSPSFTSCSSTHSPQATPWMNGVGPRRGSWDWTQRERDEWRNGDDERRKSYLKLPDERSRDRYFSSHHPADDFYKKEKLPRVSQHQRHEAKFKRRDGGADHHRSRRSESELPEDGRSRRTSRRHEREDREANDHKESTEHKAKERSSSPHSSKPTEPSEGERDRESEVECASGEDTEGECWYPNSMEELVTVDEVGEEDDSIIEPDLPELQEEEREEECEEEAKEDVERMEKKEPTPAKVDKQDLSTPDAATEETLRSVQPDCPEAPPSHVSIFHSPEFKSAPEETAEPCVPPTSVTDVAETHVATALTTIKSICETEKTTDTHTVCDRGRTAETEKTETHHVDENPKRETVPQSSQPASSPQGIGIKALSPSQEQEKIISEHSIPLGVEFIVPSTGFYCKLCSLFYTSEDMAKTTHCRSTVHYRNLQKYLSQLAEESLLHFRSDAE
ncbi:RNA-binding protein 20 isoform X2 [Tachysurus fulvidraco]|uniref:RNA-binding protein 20 isoform X2 n=1 Tax=Tachysurus fulvidraco TaxID=1234273 RepID=UPI000F4E29B3|nr:RNA-binding protein 20 isoform X2 [Tachysurus fulvidraco]